VRELYLAILLLDREELKLSLELELELVKTTPSML